MTAQNPKPPPGATTGAARGGGKKARNKADPWVMNLHPLSEPHNCLQFAAGLERDTIAKHPNAKPEVKAKVQQSISWLQWLAQRVTFASRDPVIILAMQRAAKNAEVRKGMRQALADMDDAIEAAQAQARSQAG